MVRSHGTNLKGGDSLGPLTTFWLHRESKPGVQFKSQGYRLEEIVSDIIPFLEHRSYRYFQGPEIYEQRK